ncbi:MAG: phenylacetate--CoA ligase family protein [Giesbergeria sp.]|jgi:phenylacetate-coenzyme A ligase PaaK-like adenylate-forming protein|nr:phenylacetate--CoA ligase family protein [Giesbergeria sp.]
MSPVFDLLRLSSVSMDVIAAQRGTRQGIAQRQQVRLAQVLGSALRESRFYQDLLPGGTSAHTPLDQWPVVTRGQLMECFDDWVTDPRLKLDELRAFTADPERIAEPWLGRYMVWESSGTSGQPGIFVQDAQAMAVYDALEALRRSAPRPLAHWMDPLHLSERHAFVGVTGGHFASHVTLRRLRSLNPWLAATTRSFSIQEPTADLVRALNDFAPTILITYPTVAALLAQEAESGRLHIAPREIWTGGENLGAGVRAYIEQRLGGVLRNSYGASEFLAMGWECAHGHMHLNADWLILEPVDEHYRPVPPGETPCAMLLTNLANTVQPLIRYELGDHVTVHAELCACGSPLPVIEVCGRQDDPLYMAARQGGSATLLPLALTTVLEDDAGVFDFHLRQIDDRTLVLRLPLGGEAGEAAMARCQSALKAFAAVQGLAPIRVHAELGVPVPRGRSGKACRIVGCGAPGAGLPQGIEDT